MARDDYVTRRERQRQGVQLAKTAGKYAGRLPDIATHQRIVALRGAGRTIQRTAELTGSSASQVKRIWAIPTNLGDCQAGPASRAVSHSSFRYFPHRGTGAPHH
jgi:DNA invertase Pin-like site-specific DNA recombinase